LHPARGFWGMGRAVSSPAGLGRSSSRNRTWCILALKYDIGGNYFNYYPENQLTKFKLCPQLPYFCPPRWFLWRIMLAGGAFGPPGPLKTSYGSGIGRRAKSLGWAKSFPSQIVSPSVPFTFVLLSLSSLSLFPNYRSILHHCVAKRNELSDLKINVRNMMLPVKGCWCRVQSRCHRECLIYRCHWDQWRH